MHRCVAFARVHTFLSSITLQNGFLNSYSLILLCLHYLQAVVTPAILPNLQAICPQMFAEEQSIEKCLLFQELPTQFGEARAHTKAPAANLFFSAVINPNDATLGELLIGFFDYFSAFDFDNWAISIARGCVFNRCVGVKGAQIVTIANGNCRSELCKSTDRYKMFIEEPYDRKNTARCVTNDKNFARIIEAIKHGRAAFLGKKKPDINRLGIQPLRSSKKLAKNAHILGAQI